jgi:hypothetical protein
MKSPKERYAGDFKFNLVDKRMTGFYYTIPLCIKYQYHELWRRGTNANQMQRNTDIIVHTIWNFGNHVTSKKSEG